MADIVKPQPHPGYVGMLIVTALAMLLGVVVMAMEATEYDWEPKAKPTPTIALPKGSAALDTPAPAVVADAKPEVKPSDVAKTERPVPSPKVEVPLPDLKPLLPPTDTAKTEPKPTPSPLTIPAKTPEAKPEPPKSDGPTPSPLRFGR